MLLSTFTLAFLLASLTVVTGLSVRNPQAAGQTFINEICTAPTDYFNTLEISLARDFCSVLFDIKTSTSRVTLTRTQIATAYATVTSTEILSSEETMVETTTGDSTTTKTIPPLTDSITLPASTITLISTDLETTVEGTTTVTSTETVATGGTYERRQQASGIFAPYAQSIISTACKCLVTPEVQTETIDFTAYTTTTGFITKEKIVSEVGTTFIVDTVTDVVTATVGGSVVDISLTPSPTTLHETTTTITTAEATITATTIDDVTDYYVQFETASIVGYYTDQCAYFIGNVSTGSDESPFELSYLGSQACAVTPGCLSFVFSQDIDTEQDYIYLYNALAPAYSSCYVDDTEREYIIYNFNNTGPPPDNN